MSSPRGAKAPHSPLKLSLDGVGKQWRGGKGERKGNLKSRQEKREEGV